ncbi:MAG TPA: cytochrome c [Acetobacteraceae bacterium]|nr:cytochrome c [Acetobacteraceae bacterium]
MPALPSDTSRPVRIIGPAASLVLCLLAWLLVPGTTMAGATAADDHTQAVAALTDVNAAVAELVRADASYVADPKVYHGAAQRAINALAGTHGDGYVASAGSPGDAAGAIGHIDSLLDRSATLVWTGPLQSVEANIRAAVAHLQDAAKARELMDYAGDASRALDYLQVARGRPNETGVFGGLEGVLANTELGIPAGAQQQDACRAPSSAPSYGTHGGYIGWVALPGGNGTHELPEPSGVTSLSVQNGMIVLRTAAAKVVADACAGHAKGDPPDPPATQAAAHAMQTPPAASGGGPPALYTKAQAEAGKQIFDTKCVACHGANLQGTAAPSVAGNDYLVAAQRNGWTLEIMRYIVFDQMPRNAPATLSPTDDADVMAYLLASSCYPAGTKPFPSADDPSFAAIKLGPVPGQHPGQNAKGVCPVN